MRKKILAGMLSVLMLVFGGCSGSEQPTKLRDIEFTVLSEEKIPEELKAVLEGKKSSPFQITYSDAEFLYICVGYGEQETGGYSIAVNELYLTETNICVNTSLLGPEASDKGNKTPSYPYIVLKTEYLDKTVLFISQQTDASPFASEFIYTPGIYATELVLGNQAIDVEVIVDKDTITSIRMANLSDAVTTMYPLLEPTFDSICQQVYELQSLDQVYTSEDTKYTSLVLLEAIRTSLNKASHNYED